MPKSAGQKLKLLYLVKYLTENTDENHPASTAALISYLDSQGISSERKSIYDDIAKLTEFGYDIIQVQSRSGGGYYLAAREFELAELKLLVDAVQSSRFITTRKSRELIRKLEKLAGKHDAGQLQRQVYVSGRIKTENESIYYNIDTIHRAIQENRQISFQYMNWNLKKELVSRDAQHRKVSPWALIWKEENYYLAAFDAADEKIKHFRVDKMGRVKVLDEDRIGREFYDRVDPALYTNRTFGMFAGREETVSLEFSKNLLGVVIDRFGRDCDIRSVSEEQCRVRAKVAVSGQFFGWLCGIGPDIRIVSPGPVSDEYRNWLVNILNKMSP